MAIEGIKKIKRNEFEEQQRGLLAQQPVQKIVNLFNNYAGFVNNSDVSVWNNHESSSATSQF